MEEINLPIGWRVCSLKDIATIIAGQSPPSETYNKNGIGLPFFQGKTDFGVLYPDIRMYCSSPHKIAEYNDILLSVRAPVGPTNLSPAKVCIGRGLTAIRPNAYIELKYLLYFFKLIENKLLHSGVGTTFKAITQNDVKAITVPIAPLNVQRSIIDTIDELFSELNKGIAELKKVKAQLKIYRQAVLKDAFSADCKYQRLIECVDRIFDGPFGSNLKTSDYVSEGIRVARLENIKNTWFDDSKKSFVTESKYEIIKKHTAYPTDVIMSTFISDETKVCQMPSTIQFAVNKADCIVIRPSDKILAKYIMYYLASSIVHRALSNQIHGATRPRVNSKQIKGIMIPVISIEQQKEIISLIESRLSVCDKIEQAVGDSLRKAEYLRQSILKQAFEGKLVPQEQEKSHAGQ